MLSEAYQHVATMQLGSNYCSFIAIIVALSSAALKSEQAFYSHLLFSGIARGWGHAPCGAGFGDATAHSLQYFKRDFK